MADVLEREVAGTTVRFLADRAVYWPARERLLLADLHLGKGDVFRAAGIPVPTGGTALDLTRLDALLRITEAKQLWILGDFLHGRRSLAAEQEWRELLAAHPAVSTSVICGNHDRALDPVALAVTMMPEDVDDGPFRFRHHPRPRGDTGAHHVVCGHTHPVVRLPGLPGRFPAFALNPGELVLPAFSRFTGGLLIEDAAQRWIACANGVLLDNRG